MIMFVHYLSICRLNDKIKRFFIQTSTKKASSVPPSWPGSTTGTRKANSVGGMMKLGRTSSEIRGKCSGVSLSSQAVLMSVFYFLDIYRVSHVHLRCQHGRFNHGPLLRWRFGASAESKSRWRKRSRRSLSRLLDLLQLFEHVCLLK